MNTYSDKKRQVNNDALQSNLPVQSKIIKQPVQLQDNRPQSVIQKKLVDRMGKVKPCPIQKKENNTGLPDNLKSGVENLSGHSMDDVKVHYNSSAPAQLNAHAYAQGTDIHVAPGQEKHLPHEAWHVAQQKQGRVRPTIQMKGKVNVNDDRGLEKEADEMGSRASQLHPMPDRILQGKFSGTRQFSGSNTSKTSGPVSDVIQLMPYFEQWVLDQDPPWIWDHRHQTLKESNLPAFIRSYFGQILYADPNYNVALHLYGPKIATVMSLLRSAIKYNNFELVVSLLNILTDMVESISGPSSSSSSSSSPSSSSSSLSSPVSSSSSALSIPIPPSPSLLLSPPVPLSSSSSPSFSSSITAPLKGGDEKKKDKEILIEHKKVMMVPVAGEMINFLEPGRILKLFDFEFHPGQMNKVVALVQKIDSMPYELQRLIKSKLQYGINRLYSRLLIDCLRPAPPSTQVLTTCMQAVSNLDGLGYPCMITVRDKAIFLGHFYLLESITNSFDATPRVKSKTEQNFKDLWPICTQLLMGKVTNLKKFCTMLGQIHEEFNPFREPAMIKQTAFTDRIEGYPTVISGEGRSNKTPFPLGFKTYEGWTEFKNTLVELIGTRYKYITHVVFQGSAINGVSYKPKPGATTKEFDQGRISDFDISLVSPLVHGVVEASGAKMDSVVESERGSRETDVMVEETHTPPMHQTEMFGAGMGPLVIEIRLLVNRLNSLFNREVNFMVYRTLDGVRRHEGPSLIIDIESGEVYLSGNIKYQGGRIK